MSRDVTEVSGPASCVPSGLVRRDRLGELDEMNGCGSLAGNSQELPTPSGSLPLLDGQKNAWIRAMF